MTKKLFSLTLVTFAALSALADESMLDFTYAEGELSAYGKARKETIDVAMCINDPAFIGRKLTGFRAYINTASNISNTSLWLTEELTLENKLNVPDIATYPTSPQSVNLGGVELLELSVKLDTPYLLTDQPLYLGYSLTVDATETYEDRYPLILSSGVNTNGFFLHGTNSVLKWLEYSETSGGVAYIVATIEGDYSDYSLGFRNYDIIYAPDGEKFNVDFTLLNSGTQPVENFSYTYTVDGGSEVKEGYKALDVAIQPSLSIPAVVTLPFDGITGYGPHDLNIIITEVNGNANQSDEASMTCVVNVIPFVPVHRPLVEEFTGLWCQWCPKGYIAMELIAEDYPDDQVSICYHNDDPMEVTRDYPVAIQSLPASSIDRLGQIDPYYGTYDESVQFGISYDLQNRMAEFTIASVDVEAQLEGDVVNVNSTVRFIKDVTDANYQIGYVLVCNGLTNENWQQKNAFSGMSGLEGTPLEVLATWPARVYGLVFNDVAVDVSGMTGIPNSLPKNIATNEAYSNTFSFNIAENDVIQNRDNLVVAAFIVDKSNGTIVNANKCSVKTGVVKGIGMNKEVVAREYYDITGRKLPNPGKGIFVVKEKMSDGSFNTYKIAR